MIDRPDLKARISKEGWGAKFLSYRKDNYHWGLGFYQPKWTSTHYILLDLKNLSFSDSNKEIQATIRKILKENTCSDGGINPAKTISKSDICINGMFLNYATYFRTNQNELISIVDYILSQQLPDGGFNCESSKTGSSHSSLHSTISVMEGILEYFHQGYAYKLRELRKAEEQSREFILNHKLYKSHRTGNIIDNKMLLLSYPSRWRYDILRALDYFQAAKVEFDPRMSDALNVLTRKQGASRKWPLQGKHKGQTHFDMEIPGETSRWNTLRALRVLKHFGLIENKK
jgi:hypothetical protein